MSRPMMLVLLLVALVIVSHLEWRPQLASDVDATPRKSLKLQPTTKRAEDVTEKIILSQEKNIQRLNELVRSLKEQLQECRNGTSKFSGR